MFRLVNSIYYIVRVILGLFLPHARFTSIVSIYAIVVSTTYALFWSHLYEILGPWFIKHHNDTSHDKSPIQYNDEEQTTIAIQFTSLVMFIVLYLMRDYAFSVPECVTINSLYRELETKLFWINNTYLSLTLGVLSTIAMIPVWRYCLAVLLKNDDQYRERFEQFVDKYILSFVLTCVVVVILYWSGVTIHRQWYKRQSTPM